MVEGGGPSTYRKSVPGGGDYKTRPSAKQMLEVVDRALASK